MSWVVLISKARFTSGSQESALKLKSSLDCFGSGQAESGAQGKDSLVGWFVAADVLYLYQQMYPEG